VFFVLTFEIEGEDPSSIDELQELETYVQRIGRPLELLEMDDKMEN
jgi:hypothetical protein